MAQASPFGCRLARELRSISDLSRCAPTNALVHMHAYADCSWGPGVVTPTAKKRRKKSLVACRSSGTVLRLVAHPAASRSNLGLPSRLAHQRRRLDFPISHPPPPAIGRNGWPVRPIMSCAHCVLHHGETQLGCGAKTPVILLPSSHLEAFSVEQRTTLPGYHAGNGSNARDMASTSWPLQSTCTCGPFQKDSRASASPTSIRRRKSFPKR